MNSDDGKKRWKSILGAADREEKLKSNDKCCPHAYVRTFCLPLQCGWGINNTILISKIVRLPPSSCCAGHHRRWAMVEFDSDCLIVSSSDYMGAGTHTSYTNQTSFSGNRSKWGQIKANLCNSSNQNLGKIINKSHKRWNPHSQIMLIQSSGYMLCWVHSIPYMSQNKTFNLAEDYYHHPIRMRSKHEVLDCFGWWLRRRSCTSPSPAPDPKPPIENWIVETHSPENS